MEFLHGLTMGLAYVAPIGVQNLFVINTALTQPRRRALETALLVVFFDVSLAFACFFGVGLLMSRFPWLECLLLGAGGVTVLLIGLGLLRSKAGELSRTEAVLPLSKAASTACVVTWCNPQAILDGTLMLGAFRASLSAAGGIRFIMGVGCASCLWFLGLAGCITLFSARFTPKVLSIINRVCGCVIIFYGLRLLLLFLAEL